MLPSMFSFLTITQAAGVLGFLFYITGFAGVQLGYMNGNSNAYTLTSLTGASLVLVSLTGAFNLASMLIQVSWIIICVTALLRRALNPNRNTAKP